MKHLVSPAIVLGLTAAFLLATSHAEVSPVRVRVELTSKNDNTGYKSVQSRALNIIVSNSSPEPLELKVKFAIFGRDIKTQEIVTLEQGEIPLTLKARGTEKVQSPAAHAVAEEERIGSKGKSEAFGYRIIGQAVQISKADVVVAETFEPASLKDAFGKAPMAKKPEKKKKK
jgi:hypothetical protein